MSEVETISAGVVIIGAGQAGAETAGCLRQQGYGGPITIVGEEPHLPYRRPPLSKTCLSGEATFDSLLLRKAEAYEKQNIRFRIGVAATAIDRAARTVTLGDGETLGYDKLVLATGGVPRRLTMPGADRPNVHVIRDISDVERLRADFLPDRRLLVIGGGYIGLETAAVAQKKGLQVTVLEAAPRLLARVAAPELSAFYEAAHRRRGVEIRTGVTLSRLIGDDKVEAVELSDGSRIELDLMIVGIGLVPNTKLAEDAGLAIDNGIVTDAYAQTADPDILAVGDCANHINGHLGRAVRIESVPSAMEQGRTAALTICGKPAPHAAVPWFWSDQFNLKLQMVGISQGYDRLVLRGDPASESFAAFYLRDGVVISADTINRPLEFAIAKRFVADRLCLDANQLADESVTLKTLLPAV